MNFTEEAKVIDVKDLNLINMENKEKIKEALELEPFGVRIVKVE